MLRNYILAIDNGTTSTRAVLVDAQSYEIVSSEGQEYPQIYPEPGWVEHNLNDIWNTVKLTISKLIKKQNLNPQQIIAIGITNQRETTCAFHENGYPLANAIVWQDRRTESFCKKNKKSFEKKYKKMTGLPLDAYFSATKMQWLLKNNPEVKLAAKSGHLRFGTIDTFLLYKLTKHKSFCTEASNASRTLLMNLKTTDWDAGLLKFFGISRKLLPEIKDSFGVFGVTEGLDFLPDNIPVTGILGDQQAALFGQAGQKKGAFKCTYGTGAFALLNTGDKILHSNHGLLTTVAYRYKNKTTYALEGSSYIAGAAVQWLRDNLKLVKKASEIEALAREVSNLDEMKNLLFHPFFTGIGTPYWVSEAKAAITGITRDTNASHVARACLDGIALSVSDLVSAFEGKISVREMRVDGGACANNFLMQIQANFIGKKVIRPKIIETTAYGAALAAMIGIKKIDFNAIADLWKFDQEFSPEKDLKYFKAKNEQWKNIIEKLYL
ncbi:MAG: glycerol kinase GlpK [Bacteriovoracaceae bacterium]|nr:glycerol kinase GlpK [Bacteriovoracaceae bacterium]